MKKYLIGIIFLIVIAGFFGGSVWYWQKNKNQSQKIYNNILTQQAPNSALRVTSTQELSQNNSTSTWTTYRNIEDGWAIQFPETYAISESKVAYSPNLTATIFSQSTPQKFEENNYFAKIYFKIVQKQTKDKDLKMLDYVKYLASSTFEYFDEEIGTSFNSNQVVVDTDSIISKKYGDNNVIESIHETFEGCPTFDYWFEKNNSDFIRIIAAACFEGHKYGGLKLDFRIERELLDNEISLILSSFKFIK